MIGKVKWYNIRQGYGFIQGEDGKDAFVHKTEVPFWNIYLQEGENVEYTPKNTKRGIKATELKLL